MTRRIIVIHFELYFYAVCSGTNFVVNDAFFIRKKTQNLKNLYFSDRIYRERRDF